VLAACSAQVSEGTVLTEPESHGWAIAEQTGSIFTDGFETVEPMDGPIIIEKVVAAGGSDDVRLVGVKVVGPDRDIGSVQFSEGFPPASSDFGSVPFGDLPYTVKAGQSAELLLGYEVVGEGRWHRSEVEIQYRFRGTLYEQRFHAELVVCGTSKAVARDSCT
jgi:hypothetical protein